MQVWLGQHELTVYFTFIFQTEYTIESLYQNRVTTVYCIASFWARIDCILISHKDKRNMYVIKQF